MYYLQSTNAVKAGAVKLILLAPNTEALDVLDEKIEGLLLEAEQRNIPICYCMNKRKLVSLFESLNSPFN